MEEISAGGRKTIARMHSLSTKVCTADRPKQTSSDLRVIVSHPARQANIYYRPRAAEQMGASVVFLTGLYYRPERLPYSMIRFLPRKKRESIEYELEKRRLEGLSPENVISLLGPSLEVTLRPLGKVQEWFAIHDWLAGRWIHRQKDSQPGAPILLHCFQGACRRTLQAARRKNIVRLLEVTSPPMPAVAGAPGYGAAETASLATELREAEFVLVQSEYSAQSVIALGVASEQIIRCHLGVDTSYYRPRTEQRKPGPLRVLFLGGTSIRKGVHHILQAWKELGLEGAELLIAGNRTAGLSEMPEGIPNCRILGRIPDSGYLQTLQDADVLVHPSLAEGGCNVVYEALACGTPCIVSSNATSAVRTGKEGIVFPVGNLPALKGALLLLCREPELRQQMAEAARVRAESLRWERYLFNLGLIYEQLGEYSRDRSPDSLSAILASSF